MLETILFDIDGTLIDDNSIFPKTDPQTYQKLVELKKHYNIGLFSQGFKFFQMGKLKIVGLADLFDGDKIFIAINKLALANKMIKKFGQENFLIIDNSERILKGLKKANIKCIRANSYKSIFEDLRPVI